MINRRIGDSLQLTAVRFPSSGSAGTGLPLELDWDVLGPLGREYKRFLHHMRQPGDPAPLAQENGFLFRTTQPCSAQWN